MSELKPIFIFSLPRSGSTLLQRLLASHASISTVSEPWVLLPFLYPLRKEGVWAEYSHALAHQAIADLCNALPKGREDYLAAVRLATMSMYQKLAAPGATYFLDKTPRYHLVLDEIFNTFPDARFIFLWRNPLAVIASLTASMAKGRWDYSRWEIDLSRGLDNLVRGFEQHREQVHALRYEDLVDNPASELARIHNYLGLEPDCAATDTFSQVRLEGELGDKTGVDGYAQISSEPVQKWPTVINTRYRVRWCERFLRRTGEERLGVMGYDLQELMRQLRAAETNTLPLASDLLCAAYGSLKLRVRRRLFHKQDSP